MNARTDAQEAIVARAAKEFGKGKGVDNSTTGALILYIQELERKVESSRQALRAMVEGSIR